MNEQQNVYACPVCGEQGRVGGIMPLIDNVRYDAVQCDCGAQWRVYYKFENPKTEVTYIPPQECKEDEPVEAVAEENIQGE